MRSVNTYVDTNKPRPLVGKGGSSGEGWHQHESYQLCPKKYQFKEVRRITTPARFTKDPFSVGTLLHAGRGKWFELGFPTSEQGLRPVFDACMKAAQEMPLPSSFKAEQKAHIYLQQYIDHWGMQPRPDVKAVEYKLGPVSLLKELPSAMRTSRPDDISIYPEVGALTLGDLKSTSVSVQDCVNEYTLHGQMLLAQAIYAVSKKGQGQFGPIVGTVLDIVVKGSEKQKCKFGRELIPVNPSQLQWFVWDLSRSVAAAKKVTWDSEERRVVANCTHMYGRMRVPCEYRPLCQHGKNAAGNYVFEDGTRLLQWKPEAGKQQPPWL